jgi:hypothetical protein
METSMHGSFDRSGETGDSIYRSWGFGFCAFALLAIALIGLAITQPSAIDWISETAQAEYAATYSAPVTAPARPATDVRIVRAN